MKIVISDKWPEGRQIIMATMSHKNRVFLRSEGSSIGEALRNLRIEADEKIISRITTYEAADKLNKLGPGLDLER